jgi:hypothetical protein
MVGTSQAGTRLSSSVSKLIGQMDGEMLMGWKPAVRDPDEDSRYRLVRDAEAEHNDRPANLGVKIPVSPVLVQSSPVSSVRMTQCRSFIWIG